MWLTIIFSNYKIFLSFILSLRLKCVDWTKICYVYCHKRVHCTEKEWFNSTFPSPMNRADKGNLGCTAQGCLTTSPFLPLNQSLNIRYFPIHSPIWAPLFFSSMCSAVKCCVFQSHFRSNNIVMYLSYFCKDLFNIFLIIFGAFCGFAFVSSRKTCLNPFVQNADEDKYSRH